MNKKGYSVWWIIVMGIIAFIVLIAVIMPAIKTHKEGGGIFAKQIEFLKKTDISEMTLGQKEKLVRDSPGVIARKINAAVEQKDKKELNEIIDMLDKEKKENLISMHYLAKQEHFRAYDELGGLLKGEKKYMESSEAYLKAYSLIKFYKQPEDENTRNKLLDDVEEKLTISLLNYIVKGGNIDDVVPDEKEFKEIREVVVGLENIGKLIDVENKIDDGLKALKKLYDKYPDNRMVKYYVDKYRAEYRVFLG